MIWNRLLDRSKVLRIWLIAQKHWNSPQIGSLLEIRSAFLAVSVLAAFAPMHTSAVGDYRRFLASERCICRAVETLEYLRTREQTHFSLIYVPVSGGRKSLRDVLFVRVSLGRSHFEMHLRILHTWNRPATNGESHVDPNRPVCRIHRDIPIGNGNDLKIMFVSFDSRKCRNSLYRRTWFASRKQWMPPKIDICIREYARRSLLDHRKTQNKTGICLPRNTNRIRANFQILFQPHGSLTSSTTVLCLFL